MTDLFGAGGRRRLVALALVALVALLGGCGSGALQAPQAQDPPSTGTATGTAGEASGEGRATEAPEPDEVEYGWGLPAGPYTPDDTFEDDVYGPLAAGACVDAQERLNELWQLLDSPRGVLLYQAGVEACRGDLSSARTAFARAGDDGWVGVDWVASGGFTYDCQVYRSLRSVLDQRDRATTTCPGGTPVGWPNPDRGVSRDDPRTQVDESAPAPPTGEPTADPTAGATADPTTGATADPADAPPGGPARRNETGSTAGTPPSNSG